MQKFIIVFYNRFACQTQTFKVMAKDEEDAERIFRLKYPESSYYDCIENIYEHTEHFYTEEEILKQIARIASKQTKGEEKNEI